MPAKKAILPNSSKNTAAIPQVRPPRLITLCRQWPERRKQFGQHPMGLIPAIEAVFKFLGVFAKVLWRYPDMSAID